MSSDALREALTQLAEVLQTQSTLGGALAQITEAATVSVPGCDAASVALSINGRPATAAATARVALEMDLVQYDLHDGPCLTAFRTMQSLRLDLVEMEEKLPNFARAARRHGVVAVLSMPAMWGAEVIATLNLYSRTAPFEEEAATVAAVLATQVTMAVSRSPEFAAARNVVEQAQRDADDLTDINRATGMLMATKTARRNKPQVSCARQPPTTSKPSSRSPNASSTNIARLAEATISLGRRAPGRASRRPHAPER